MTGYDFLTGAINQPLESYLAGAGSPPAVAASEVLVFKLTTSKAGGQQPAHLTRQLTIL